MDPPPPAAASDAQWRTTCRTCGSSFKSRNQLMRHLYRSHPGKPAKSKAAQKTPKPVPPPSTPPNPATTGTNTDRPPSQVHPFLILSEQQRTVYVARILSAVFAVCMKQMEEKEERQQGQNEHEIHNEEQHQDMRPAQDHQTAGKELDTAQEPLSGPPNDGSMQDPDQKPPGSNSAPKDRPIPDQPHRGNGSELEDSDDDDGGVTLFAPRLGSLPLRLRDGQAAMDGLEGDLDLD